MVAVPAASNTPTLTAITLFIFVHAIRFNPPFKRVKVEPLAVTPLAMAAAGKGFCISADAAWAPLAAGFAADDINGLAASDLIEPRGEDGIGRELPRVAGEFNEGGLGDLLGQLRRADLTERGGMDKVEMAPDDFGEGVLGVVPGVA